MSDNLPEKSDKRYPSDPSERAKMLVAEGKIGGRRPGAGRPRKQRASELVAEEAVKHKNKIVAAYLDSLDPKKPAHIRLQAARDWLQIEHREADLQLKEDRAFEEASPEELIEFIISALPGAITNTSGVTTGAIDATFEEIAPEGSDRDGEDDQEPDEEISDSWPSD